MRITLKELCTRSALEAWTLSFLLQSPGHSPVAAGAVSRWPEPTAFLGAVLAPDVLSLLL